MLARHTLFIACRAYLDACFYAATAPRYPYMLAAALRRCFCFAARYRLRHCLPR